MSDQGKTTFKNWYIFIFSINYLIQGVVWSMFSVIIPIYLLILISETGATITASDIAFLAAIIMIPWAIKLIFGILSDKFGTKKFGRRKPWIIGSITLAGIMWIIMPFVLTPANAIIIFTILGLLINMGVAFADTALDGLILDICPKEQLGRAQGTCWGFRSVGQIAAGPILAIIVVSISASVNSLFIIIGILMIVASLTILIIKEAEEYPEVNIIQNLKMMLSKKRDWKIYLFALFNAIVDGVIILFLSLYLLIQMGFIEAEGASLSLLEGGTDMTIYLQQANLSIIIGVGIVIGAIVGGAFSDLISRRKSVYISLIITTVTLLVIFLPFQIIILLIIACMIGIGMGWRHSSYSAVLGEMAKEYPELNSTYYSIANSFVNFGTIIGLSIVGLIFEQTASFILVFIIMAIASNFGLLPFLLIDKDEYELKPASNKEK